MCLEEGSPREIFLTYDLVFPHQPLLRQSVQALNYYEHTRFYAYCRRRLVSLGRILVELCLQHVRDRLSIDIHITETYMYIEDY